MPCWSGHTPQQMDALLVLVTDGMVARPRRNIPRLRHSASVGISLAARYSRPKPSHMITTARCGARWAKAGAAIAAPAVARNSRRDGGDVLINPSCDVCTGRQNVDRVERLAGRHKQPVALGAPKTNIGAI